MTTVENTVGGGAAEEHRHEFTIIVNGRERKVESQVLTFDEVVHLAFNPLPPGKDFTVAYRDAERPKHHGTLVEGESVTIKNGTAFHVRATNKA